MHSVDPRSFYLFDFYALKNFRWVFQISFDSSSRLSRNFIFHVTEKPSVYREISYFFFFFFVRIRGICHLEEVNKMVYTRQFIEHIYIPYKTYTYILIWKKKF